MSEAPPTVAVVDLGSNSARLVVFALSAGYLDVVRDARASIKLLRHIDADGNLDSVGLDSAVEILTHFRTLVGRGVPILAVGTSALRGTADAPSILAELKARSRVPVRLLDGPEEAELACIGAIHGLPLESGLVLDIGGGSMELARFEGRRRVTTWTYPLGALRVSDATLRSDPPSKAELRALADLVSDHLGGDLTPVLASEGGLVATGGTARAVAKLHRAHFPHLLDHLHGYTMTAADVDRVFDLVARTSSDRLKRIAGVGGRFDSVVGGTGVIRAAMDFVGADHLTVSGQGLREGIALRHFGVTHSSPAENRRRSVAAVARRFTTCEPRVASRRAALATAVFEAAAGSDPDTSESLQLASVLCDAGRAVSRTDGFTQAARIALATDLAGFGHIEVARMAALLEKAGESRATLAHYRPAFSREAFDRIELAAMALRVGDEVEPWLPLNAATTQISASMGDRRLTLRTPLAGPCRPALSERLVRARLARELVVSDGSGDTAMVALEIR